MSILAKRSINNDSYVSWQVEPMPKEKKEDDELVAIMKETV